MSKRRSNRPSAASALPEAALELLARRFRMLSDVRRLRILKALLERERTVGEIDEICGTTQANVSMHLSHLRADGLVEARREGARKVYRILDPTLADLCAAACRAIETRVQDDLDRLRP